MIGDNDLIKEVTEIRERRAILKLKDRGKSGSPKKSLKSSKVSSFNARKFAFGKKDKNYGSTGHEISDDDY